MRKLLLLAAALLIFLVITAQPTKHKFMYIQFQLGSEISHVGAIRQGDHAFELEAISRFPHVTAHKMKGIFYPSGELQQVEGYNYLPGTKSDSVLYQYKLIHAGDSTLIEQIRDGKSTTQKFKGKTMLANSLGGTILPFMPVLLMPYAPPEVGSSVTSTHWVLGTAFPFIVQRPEARKLSTHSSPMGSFHLLLNEKGELESIDAIGSSWNLTGSLLATADLPALLKQFILIERNHKPLGPINPAAITEGQIGDARVRIEYAQPAARGRVVFGNIVPWNRVWRTGANAATKLTTDKTLSINGQEIPPGSYAIFTIPAPDGWQLMVNREADTWGTEYKADHDLLKAPMKVVSLPEYIESMSIELKPEGTGKSALQISWEKIQASILISRPGF